MLANRLILSVAMAGLIFNSAFCADDKREVVSPEIGADRAVTFRIKAPKAQEVTVIGDWGGKPTPCTKDDQGVWSVTINTLKPDIYGYSFVVDGLTITDPQNVHVKPARSSKTSVLEIPGETPRIDEAQKNAHGTVHVHFYDSISLGKQRRLHVYTPPGYESSNTQFPTLYLLHGYGDNDASWTGIGRANVIFDNLLAENKVQPMVIVMTDGHAAFNPDPKATIAEKLAFNLQAYEGDLLKDVIPLIEKTYRVEKSVAKRAICGLSMGGGQSLTIGLNHLDTFSWVCGFSAAVFEPEKTGAAVLAEGTAANSKISLLWIGCGKDDKLVKHAEDLSSLLKQKGIEYQLHITEGNHSWPVWRRYLAEVLPMLFVKK